MNLWEQYNPSTPLGNFLSEKTGVALQVCNDKALFEALKRHLTRRELRCLIMNASGAEIDAIASETGFDSDEVNQAVHKAEKKLRQPKLAQEFQKLIGDAMASEDDEA